MSVILPEDSSWYKGAERFAELIEKRTNGKYVIDIYPNGQLAQGNQKKELEMLQSGAIDITYHSTILYTIIDPKFGIFSLPWLFRDFTDVEKVFNSSFGDYILSSLEKYNIKGLAWGENGFREITNNKKEILYLRDIKGLKIRIPGIKMYSRIFRLLDANPMVMNWGEVFTSLQQGVIDGQENPIVSVILPSKLYEVQQYISIWHYSYDALILGMNKKLFDSLNPEDREIFLKSAQEASLYQRKLSREGLEAAIGILAEKGMKVSYVSKEEIKLFKEKVEPVYEEYEHIVGEENLEKIRCLVAGEKNDF